MDTTNQTQMSEEMKGVEQEGLQQQEQPQTMSINPLHAYQHGCDEMIAQYAKGTNAGYAEAERIAQSLLNSSAPVIIQVRSHIILGCGTGVAFLWHANQAVRLMEMGIAILGSGDAELSLLEVARAALAMAQKDYDELVDETEEDEEEDEKEDGEDEELKENE